MIKICPTCGDFYADASLLFCPTDGTPLADVSTHDETWAEGSRVVEEKERVLRSRTRRLKLRRALMTTMTVLITTMVVCVVVANTYIYLAPQPDAPVVAAAVTPRPSPKPSETPTPTPTPDTTSGVPFVPFVPATPTPDPSSTPGTTPNSKGPATHLDNSPPAQPATPTTDTPTVTETPTVVETPPRTPTPTPTPTIESTPPPPPPSPPAPKCTGDDKRRMRDEIVARYSAAWEEAIGSERDAIVRAYAPDGAVRPGVSLLGPILYSMKFSKTCEPISVTAVYVWRVKWDGPPAPDRTDNRDERPASRGGEKKVFRTKTFGCASDGAAWRCG